MKNIILLILLFSSTWAGSVDLGEELPIISVLPFLGILFSIAIVPLLKPDFWHRNFGKISMFWALLFLIPFSFKFGVNETTHQFLHVILLEYIPFIILLFSLFTISGGIRLKGTLIGTPKLNAILIVIGTFLASWMGTTGAAMLFIRPLIRANMYRQYNVHTIIFFIFLVGNIGGSLTPLGDPPLFLGFLNGVDFFWTTSTMLLPMLFCIIILIILYYFMDGYFYKKEKHILKEVAHKEKISVEGKNNIILIFGVIFSVLLSGFWKPNILIPEIAGIHLEIQNIIRDILLLLLGIISLMITPKITRKENGFTWFPIVEVSKLFAGIFVTIIPAISILKSGIQGKLGFLINMLNDSNGEPINLIYFWITGILSSLLDNAPTYLVFFNIAGSSAVDTSIADYLMNSAPNTLLAISMGSVFMGAMTYIGNAPNFMIKSISEENNIKMPSFFGFMIWSILFLTPTYFIIGLIFL